MIFCAMSIQNTQGPIGPGQWKLGLMDRSSKEKIIFIRSEKILIQIFYMLIWTIVQAEVQYLYICVLE